MSSDTSGRYAALVPSLETLNATSSERRLMAGLSLTVILAAVPFTLVLVARMPSENVIAVAPPPPVRVVTMPAPVISAQAPVPAPAPAPEPVAKPQKVEAPPPVAPPVAAPAPAPAKAEVPAPKRDAAPKPKVVTVKKQRKLAKLGDDFDVWPEAAPAPPPEQRLAPPAPADDLKHLSSVAPP